jgi:hypothetical protein
MVKLRHMGYAVLAIHHTNKAGDQRGASILEVPMDYIIKLSHPDKSDAAFKQGACFNVEFTKVRNKAPKIRDFMVELTETADGSLDFAINTSLTEVPHEYALLRAIAECDVKPSVRILSKRLGFSAGKISKLMGKLKSYGVFIGESYILTDRGKCMLHEWFPQSYPEPDSFTAYQNEMPF